MAGMLCTHSATVGLPSQGTTRMHEPSISGVFVSVSKCFCFPTSGSTDSTNGQNVAVWLIVSSRECPRHARKMFFLQMCGSLESVSEPGAWRDKVLGWVCGWGKRALLLTSKWYLLGGSRLRFQAGRGSLGLASQAQG